MRPGYFAIGIEHTKTSHNVGSLWRTASILGAAFCFTVGRRYQRQPSDTTKTSSHIPLFHFASLDAMYDHLPHGCMLIGLELHERSYPIATYQHPARACYLLGAEDNGLSREAVERCHQLVQLPGESSLNVAVAGSIVLYDRHQKDAVLAAATVVRRAA
jgi:tRNA G18 (ribose-2'-O)-methylase SpoU